MTPEDTVLAIEVGTLRAGAIPRFSWSSLGQMSVDCSTTRTTRRADSESFTA